MTLFLLTHFLSPVEQGLYYTFISLLGVQIVFELGLSQVILQFASHERAKLNWVNGYLEGDPSAKARLASLLRLSLAWYGVVALLFAMVVLPLGLLFFRSHVPAGVPVLWQGPWIWTVLVAGGLIAASPLLAMLEGCGLVAEIALLQAVQNVASSFMLWLVLLGGWKLFAVPASYTTILICTVLWLERRYFPALKNLLAAARSGIGIGWREEIWPFQWKIALSWLSGYFIFQLFIPLLFFFHDPVAAGQMGLSLAITNTIAVVSLSWMTTKSAPFGMWIARRDFVQLDQVFLTCLRQSLAVALVGGVLFWCGAYGLHLLRFPLSLRLLPPLPLALLVGTSLMNHVVSSEAIYLRAHKAEPFLGLSITVACLVSSSAYLLGKPYGALGMTAGCFLTTLVVGLGGGTWLFVKKRNLWHQSYSASESFIKF